MGALLGEATVISNSPLTSFFDRDQLLKIKEFTHTKQYHKRFSLLKTGGPFAPLITHADLTITLYNITIHHLRSLICQFFLEDFSEVGQVSLEQVWAQGSLGIQTSWPCRRIVFGEALG